MVAELSTRRTASQSSSERPPRAKKQKIAKKRAGFRCPLLAKSRKKIRDSGPPQHPPLKEERPAADGSLLERHRTLESRNLVGVGEALLSYAFFLQESYFKCLGQVLVSMRRHYLQDGLGNPWATTLSQTVEFHHVTY